MAMTAPPPARTARPTAAQVKEAADRERVLSMLAGMTEVGSIELKMTVPARQRIALMGLDLDFLKGQIREVYFFDTPELTLFQNGVVPRARRTQGKPDDTVVKLRPVVPSELPPEVRSSPNLKVEMDIVRGSHVISASLKAEREPGAVKEAVTGKRPISKLFNKEQRAFFDAHAPAGVSWDQVVPLGPAYVVLLKAVPPGFGRKLTIEQWHYPGEVPLVELSTKAALGTVLEVLADSVTYLRAHGLQAEGEQEPKTRKALEFFAKQYAATRGG